MWTFMLLVVFLLLDWLPTAANDDQIATWEYQAWYNENLIANRFAPMAAASYGGKDQVESCIAKVFPDGAFLLKYVEVECPRGVTSLFGHHFYCAAFVALASAEKAIILSFRGSLNEVQVVDQTFATLSLVHPSAQPGGIVHKYFMDVYKGLTEGTGLMEDLQDALNEYPDYELWITGHSLGGSLAALAAGALVATGVNEKNLKLVTFGQPRTGNKLWAESMDNLIKTYKYRVISGDDIVPQVPFSLNIPITIPFTGTTIDLGIGPTWLHFTGEVWYPGGANKIGEEFKVCNQTNEQDGCSGFSQNVFKDLFSTLSFSETEIRLYNCVTGKLSQGAFHANKIAELAQNVMKQQHIKNFGIDFNATGHNACSQLWN